MIILRICIPTSAIFGSIIAYFKLLNKESRRKILLQSDFISIFGLVISIISINHNKKEFLLFGIILCGITTGLNSILVPIYIKEISPLAIT